MFVFGYCSSISLHFSFLFVVSLLLVLSLCVDKIIGESGFFISCDKNHDKVIDRKELATCYSSLVSIQSEDQINKLLQLLDFDSDGVISLEEFHRMSSTLHPKQQSNNDDHKDDEMEIDFTTYDGQHKTISMEELLKRSSYNDYDLKYMDGKLTQEKSGSIAVDNIEKTNPQIARHISVAKWAHQSLMNSGYGYGNITNIKSVPIDSNRFESGNDFKSSRQHTTIRIQLSIYNETNYQNQTFEVDIAMDKEVYVKPHMAVTKAYEILLNGDRIELQIILPRLGST